jgi:hypothetical protein
MNIGVLRTGAVGNTIVTKIIELLSGFEKSSILGTCVEVRDLFLIN